MTNGTEGNATAADRNTISELECRTLNCGICHSGGGAGAGGSSEIARAIVQ